MLFWLARLASTMGYQMLALTIGWQIYELTNSAFDLGLVGLIQFVPAVVLTLLIGHAADRYDRRLIVRTAQGTYALAAVMITARPSWESRTRASVRAVFMIGCARAFEMPTAHALAPSLVPPGMISRAVAAWTSANQTAVICGPALGGLIYALSPVPSASSVSVFFLLDHVGQFRPRKRARRRPRAAHICFGFRRIRIHPYPAPAARRDYARPVRRDSRRRHGAAADLRQGHSGGRADRARFAALGAGGRRADHLDRALPASRRAAYRSQDVCRGRNLRRDHNRVRAFSSFPLSLLSLAVLGASDAVSVVIRFSLVQIETPTKSAAG